MWIVPMAGELNKSFEGEDKTQLINLESYKAVFRRAYSDECMAILACQDNQPATYLFHGTKAQCDVVFTALIEAIMNGWHLFAICEIEV